MSLSDEELIEAAKSARAHAYAPYSGFKVGAALLDEAGRLHVGCNVENSSFPEGTCAETGAISAMVAAGGTKIAVIAAVGGFENLEACTPCGGCRQRIAEFSDGQTRVLFLDAAGKTVEQTVAEMLPESFRLERR